MILADRPFAYLYISITNSNFANWNYEGSTLWLINIQHDTDHFSGTLLIDFIFKQKRTEVVLQLHMHEKWGVTKENVCGCVRILKFLLIIN